MGNLNVRLISLQKELNTFTQNLLNDLRALELMLNEGWFSEEETIHLGAEQQICLVDKHIKPAPMAMPILEALNNSKFTTELAKFNI